VTKKILDMIIDLAKDEDKYLTFWKYYGKNIKMGLLDPDAAKDKLMKLLRFKTSKSLDKAISFE